LFLALMLGCKGSQTQTMRTQASNDPDDPPSVVVSIEPDGPQTPDHWKYRAKYVKGGKTARFGVEFFLSKSAAGANNIHQGSGSFIAEPGSDNSDLLADLKKSLQATRMPGRDLRVPQLPFEFVILGEDLDRGRDGGLIDAATGKWVGAKLFLATDDESEFYFNFEKQGGKAEFTLKDPDYGNTVLRELAKVL
jgi:hypothetical protein